MGWSNANRDPRWQGRPGYYFTAFTLKNILLIILSILVVVETSLHKKWRGDDRNWDYGR
jgi:hypothetical protein